MSFQQQDRLVVDDLETLKVLADPFRVRILLEMVAQPVTAKTVAQTLGVTPNKLYYHINLLEKHGLIAVAETHVVSGIIEKSYQTTALDITVAPDLLRLSADPAGNLLMVLDSVFGATRADVMQAAEAGLIKPEPEQKPRIMHVTRNIARLTGEQREAFLADLNDLVERFAAHDAADGDPVGLTVIFHPAVRESDPHQDSE